jgi:hypothetical protein
MMGAVANENARRQPGAGTAKTRSSDYITAIDPVSGLLDAMHAAGIARYALEPADIAAVRRSRT